MIKLLILCLQTDKPTDMLTDRAITPPLLCMHVHGNE